MALYFVWKVFLLLQEQIQVSLLFKNFKVSTAFDLHLALSFYLVFNLFYESINLVKRIFGEIFGRGSVFSDTF